MSSSFHKFLLGLLMAVAVTGCTKKVVVHDNPGGGDDASHGSVSGRVEYHCSDGRSPIPLEGAVVRLGDHSDYTSGAGFFSIVEVPVGYYTLTVDAPGFDRYVSGERVVKDLNTRIPDIIFPAGVISCTTSITLIAVADTYTQSDPGSQGNNYGSDMSLYTGRIPFGASDSSIFRSFVKFDLSSIPHGAVITNARLVLFDENNGSPGRHVIATVRISQVLGKDWTEFGLTFSNSPIQFKPLASISVDFDAIESSHEFDVVSAVSSWTGGANPNYGFSIQSSNLTSVGLPTSDFCAFYSHNLGGGAAVRLEVEYAK